MKISFKKTTVLLLIAFLAVTGIAIAAGNDAKKTMMESDWRFHDIVDVEFVKQYAVFPVPENIMIIDARPYQPKYVNGHLPGAVSIPNIKFDDMTNLLPENKEALLIYYCGGFECKLSHKSAKKAEKLGYKNVKVFAAGFPAWVKQSGSYAEVSLEYVEKQIASNEMLLVDSRPKETKFDKGFIPSAISLPFSKFNKLKGKLPADKNNLLVFYCEGFECKLSHKSAAKAIALGYTKVKVFAAGYPAWKKVHGDAGSTALSVKGGKEEGSIDIEEFKKIVAEKPDSIFLVDVRDKDEFTKKGHIPSSVNIPTDTLEKMIEKKTLPLDKPIVFVCSTGARSGEAYYMMQDLRPDVKEVYYVEAGVTFKKDGTFTIKKME